MKQILKNTLYFMFSKYIFRKGGEGSIYITFDDGPHPDNTIKIIDILEKEDIKVTFFMVGKDMDNYPEVVRSVVKAGHTIGYHSYKHDNLRKLKFSEIISEFKQIKELGKRHDVDFKYYRPPYGALSLFGVICVIYYKLRIAMWSLDSMDSFDDDIGILENVSPNKISDREIVLFHDDYEITVNLLPLIIQRYKQCSIHCDKLI